MPEVAHAPTQIAIHPNLPDQPRNDKIHDHLRRIEADRQEKARAKEKGKAKVKASAENLGRSRQQDLLAKRLRLEENRHQG